MSDLLQTALVVIVFILVVAFLARGYSRSLRPLLWLALAEYLACAAAAFFYVAFVKGGGDMLTYAHVGAALAKYLDVSFDQAAPELLAMLLQRPSRFDVMLEAASCSNTGSMFAMAAWLEFVFRGADHAMLAFISGCSLLGSLGVFRAFHDAFPDASPRRLFAASVMFPSIAFWTSALHKEAFCLMGMGALLSAWRCLYRGHWVRALVGVSVGTALILIFRAPVLAPLLIGLAIFYAVDRMQKARGIDSLVLGPAYVALALMLLAAGLALVASVSPSLAPDKLTETIATQHATWAQFREGSAIGDADDVMPQTVGGQLARVPLALVNALLRPQLFDVRNGGMLISAIEMSAVTWMALRAIRYHGLRGAIVQIQRSPFLLMCAVITLIGCAFIGLVTLNLGTLARYRVPFLPFYGVLVAVLTDRSRRAPRSRPALAETLLAR
jgi:hypothetical protein